MGENAPPIRRSFVQVHEVGGLIVGALRGRPSALRRILGARRAGRYGSALLLGAVLIAAPPWQLAGITVTWVLLAAGVWRMQRHAVAVRPLGLREVLRVSLWSSASLVFLAAPLRGIGASGVAVPVALALSALRLHHHLTRAATPPSPPRARSRPTQRPSQES